MTKGSCYGASSFGLKAYPRYSRHRPCGRLDFILNPINIELNITLDGTLGPVSPQAAQPHACRQPPRNLDLAEAINHRIPVAHTDILDIGCSAARKAKDYHTDASAIASTRRRRAALYLRQDAQLTSQGYSGSPAARYSTPSTRLAFATSTSTSPCCHSDAYMRYKNDNHLIFSKALGIYVMRKTASRQLRRSAREFEGLVTSIKRSR